MPPFLQPFSIASPSKKFPLRIGLVGAGYIAEPHILAAQAHGNLVVLCDTSDSRANALAKRFHIPSVVKHHSELLKFELDVVHVLTPPASHAELVIELLEQGVNVFCEKPLCLDNKSIKKITKAAQRSGKKVGTSHNFLFSPVYHSLLDDLTQNRFGTIEQIEIIWNKELGQIKGGPHTGWLFAEPGNVIHEVGAHSFSHLLHLMGSIDDSLALDAPTVRCSERTELPYGRYTMKRWEMLSEAGSIGIRMRFYLGEGMSDHRIVVRGTLGSAVVDFEKNTCLFETHGVQMVDVDRYQRTMNEAKQLVLQAHQTFGHFVLGKVGAVSGGKPFFDSIAFATHAFYQAISTGTDLDPRISLDLAAKTTQLMNQVVEAANLAPVQDTSPRKSKRPAMFKQDVDAVVFGGSGFMGKDLVQTLASGGYTVRAVLRNIASPPPELIHPNVQIVPGDFTDTASSKEAMEGARAVYHLARGHGRYWEDYLAFDVEPTLALANAAKGSGVKRFFYTSSIVIYWAGASAAPISEDTPPHPGILRTQLYARAKWECESQLSRLCSGAIDGFNVITFRPGVVIGKGGHPHHWGVGAWPYPALCRLWGNGNHPLPFVLSSDCALAMTSALAALDSKLQLSSSYNLIGDVRLTGHEYLDEVERTSGQRIRRESAHPTQLLIEDAAKYVVKSLGRDPHRRLPSYKDGDGRTLAATFINARAKNELKWEPVNDRERFIKEGIQEPVQQYL